MAFAYSIKDQGAVHFVTFTVHQWVDVFTRQAYLSSISYCQEHKGLEVYTWVVMSNHLHMIVRAQKENLSDVIRDMKKHTSRSIYKAIKENPKESRKREEGYHGEEIFSLNFYESKMNYIHKNPVRAGIVEKEEEYLNSSAGDCYGIRKGKLKLSKFG